MITFYQHVYPIFDYRERAEIQRERIRKAFVGSNHPYQIVSVQAYKETETLRRLVWDAYKDGSAWYAYIHLKGITHPDDRNVDDWRELLEYFTIDCWRLVRRELENGNDAVGVNLLHDPWTHFSGNFFWIRRDAVMRLEPPNTLDNPEKWIGTHRLPFVMKSLHDSNVNHYMEPYAKERYR